MLQMLRNAWNRLFRKRKRAETKEDESRAVTFNVGARTASETPATPRYGRAPSKIRLLHFPNKRAEEYALRQGTMMADINFLPRFRDGAMIGFFKRTWSVLGSSRMAVLLKTCWRTSCNHENCPAES